MIVTEGGQSGGKSCACWGHLSPWWGRGNNYITGRTLRSVCVFFFFYAVNVDESCLAAARHLIHFLFYTVGTVDGFMGEKIKKIPFNFQSRRVTVFSRWLQVKTRLLTWVKVGLSPAPKGIFRPRLQIQPFFFFLTFCDTLKWSRLNTSWPWDSSPAARLYSSTLHFFFF